MAEKYVLDGNGAAVEAIRLARAGVVAAYPITPQSPIAEKLSDLCVSGTLQARYVRVESEHSAMSVAVGAQLTGVRAATATSSVGLALMHEVLNVASGLRLPLVMPVVNRALASPWNLWCDHQDSMAERDSGWIQVYAENAQEVLDWMLAAYRLAEQPDVLTPAMVCMDGFFVSHCSQPVWVPSQEDVDAFLPPYTAANLLLDPNRPMIVNPLIPPAEFSEMRYQQKCGFERALASLPAILDEFNREFGRACNLVEAYQCQGAKAVVVAMGSMCGAARQVVKEMRHAGLPVGLLKVSVFRPFPVDAVQLALETAAPDAVIGVLDRSAGLGAQGGPLWLEICSTFKRTSPVILPYVAGLGGRDVTGATLRRVFDQLLANHPVEVHTPWVDTRPDAMQIRTLRPEEAK